MALLWVAIPGTYDNQASPTALLINIGMPAVSASVFRMTMSEAQLPNQKQTTARPDARPFDGHYAEKNATKKPLSDLTRGNLFSCLGIQLFLSQLGRCEFCFG